MKAKKKLALPLAYDPFLEELVKGLDGQLMVTAAFRYCLGRQTYIVSACCSWLKGWWHKFDTNTQNCIVRDIIIALKRGDAGGSCDAEQWKTIAQYGFRGMKPADKTWCKLATSYVKEAWPLECT